MTKSRVKILVIATLVGGAMTIGTGAQAYGGGPWGDPWGDPWSERGRGGGPWSEPALPYRSYGPPPDRTHQRQSQMRDHRVAMQSLSRMLSGRRNFDRAEAIGLAREIEASAGENLVRLFESSGNWQSSPFTRARVGEDMKIFRSHAIALQWSAGELADQLEKQPSAEDIRAGLAWSPDWGRGGSYRSRWRNEGGALTRDVFNAYTNLQATCNTCHKNFRSARR